MGGFWIRRGGAQVGGFRLEAGPLIGNHRGFGYPGWREDRRLVWPARASVRCWQPGIFPPAISLYHRSPRDPNHNWRDHGLIGTTSRTRARPAGGPGAAACAPPSYEHRYRAEAGRGQRQAGLEDVHLISVAAPSARTRATVARHAPRPATGRSSGHARPLIRGQAVFSVPESVHGDTRDDLHFEHSFCVFSRIPFVQQAG